MPIFEYVCIKCGNVFSVLTFSASEGKDKSCPSCGSRDVVKKLSSFSCSSSPGSSGGFSTGGGGG